MTFTMADMIAGKRMIVILWRERLFIGKQSDHRFKKRRIISAFDDALIVFFI